MEHTPEYDRRRARRGRGSEDAGMGLSGPEAMKSLDDAIRDIRREEQEIGGRLARRTERVVKLRESEAELFSQLAQTRLDPEVRQALEGRISKAEKNAQAVADRVLAESAEIETALAEIDRTISDQARMRRRLLETLETEQAKLRALSDKIAKAVEKDPEYKRQRELTEQLQAVAQRSLEKAQQAEADREEKGRPYREDPLFMYLWENGYGTRNYRASNLTRWLDGAVARLVGFAKARPNFALLNEIPLRLREHADRQVEAARQADDALDMLETRAIDAAGGAQTRNAISQAQEKVDKIDAEMLALEDERDKKAIDYRHKVEGRDPDFRAALGDFASALSHQDVRDLMQAARATSSPRDDAIVKKIEDVRVRLAEEEQDGQEDRARLKLLAERRRELEDIEFEFKSARYDDPRSVFQQENLAGDLLSEFLRGAISAASYWDAWQNSQRWRPGTGDWGGGFGLPNKSRRGDMGGAGGSRGGPWGGGSGGGFSRPRTGSRGSRRSGGFRTGGGF